MTLGFEQILIIIVAIFINSVFIIMLIRDLKRGTVSNLVAGTVKLYDKSKYPEKKGVVSISKKQFPRQYWIGMIFRILMLIFVFYVDYRVYLKYL